MEPVPESVEPMLSADGEHPDGTEAAPETRMRPGVERAYRGVGFVVTWEPTLCVHSERCFRSLPRVFRPWDRPWVHVGEATAGRIAEVVATCPSSALKFERSGAEPTAEDGTLQNP
jgi:uncharacterized Fe-S cluster protein YjdI